MYNLVATALPLSTETSFDECPQQIYGKSTTTDLFLECITLENVKVSH